MVLSNKQGFRGVLHAITHAGVKPHTDARLRKQLFLTNVYAMVVGGLTVCWYTIFTIFFETFLDGTACAVAASCVLAIWLNHLGHSIVSRLLILGTANGACLIYALALGPESGVSIMFLPLVCAPMAFFDLHDRKPMALAMPLPIVFATGVHWFQLDHGALLVAPLDLSQHVHAVSLITTAFVLVALMAFLYHVHASSEALLEQRYRKLISYASDGVFLLDIEGRILEANEEGCRQLGSERKAIIGISVEQIDPTLDAAGWQRLLRAIDGDRPISLERNFRRVDGESYPVQLRAGTVGEGAHMQVLLAARDTSEQKRLDAKLRLADRMVSVGTLAAGVAHEINNPITYVMLNLHRAQRKLPGVGEVMDRDRHEEIIDGLAMACHGSEAISTIVNDLKTFSREGSDQHGPIQVQQILDATLRLADHDLRKTCVVQVERASLPHVIANEARLGQVILNVLLNAAHAMSRVDRPGHLSVRTSCDDDHVIIEITDNGEGIDPENVDRVFDPFFTTRQDGTGTGLGLYVCRNLVREVGGDIHVDSQPGVGSTFRIVLLVSERRQQRIHSDVWEISGRARSRSVEESKAS